MAKEMFFALPIALLLWRKEWKIPWTLILISGALVPILFALGHEVSLFKFHAGELMFETDPTKIRTNFLFVTERTFFGSPGKNTGRYWYFMAWALVLFSVGKAFYAGQRAQLKRALLYLATLILFFRLSFS